MNESFTAFLNTILNPSEEYTPIPFWFLNDFLNKDELKRQLIDFKAKGVDGVVLHPRIGIPNNLQYLSEEYFDLIIFIVQTAAELNMRIVLYDEAMYPSGSAHGEVVKANPLFASIGITKTSNPGSRKIIAVLKDNTYIVQDFSRGTIRGIHFGEDDKENPPLSADILNPDAVEKFIELTHERYYQHLKDYFGNTIIGFFTDEPCALGRNATGFFEWTEGLEKEIISAGGKLEELQALFEHKENETTRIYHSIIKKRLNETFYQKLSDWCEKHGITLMGHPEKSDDIDEEKYFHIPGQDLVFRLVSPEKGGITGVDSVQAKCSSDAARHSGKRRNSNECFGVCGRKNNPWHFTGGDMKWFIDWLGVRGVNLFIPHAFYYSINGKRKDERPPDVGPNNIWWKHYRLFSDYMKRISYIMTDSVNCAKVAVICESGKIPSDKLVPFYENQIEFNYLPLLMLPTENTGTLCVNGYTYPYYFSAHEMNLPAKRIFSCYEVERDFATDSPQKALRVTHLVKDGINMYFLTNEGEELIQTTARVPVLGTPVYMDLWHGKYRIAEPNICNRKTILEIFLKRRESLLILFSPKEISQTKILKQKNLNNLNFKLLSHNNTTHIKIYETIYITDEVTGQESFSVQAEEMVECYCNGKFAGVSFWNPHDFCIGNYLKKGENQIKLIVTGSAANNYTNDLIAYGLMQ